MQANGFSIRYADGGRRSRGHHRFARARRAHMPRDIGITRADALYPSSNPFRKE